MIDSVSSIMSAISMLGNAGRIGDLANADPAFLQLLQALAGPSTGTNGSLPGVALQAARGTEALAALPGVAVHDDAPAGASDSGPTAAPPETPPTLGKDQDSPTAALEMVLALMAALASPLQPWQASAPGDTEVKSIEATTSDGQVAAVTAPGDAAPSPSAGAIPSAEAPTAGQPALAMGDGQVTLAGLLAGGRQARASEQTGGGQAAQAGEAMTAVGGKTEIQPRPDEARPGESRPAALSLPTADAGSTEGTFVARATIASGHSAAGPGQTHPAQAGQPALAAGPHAVPAAGVPPQPPAIGDAAPAVYVRAHPSGDGAVQVQPDGAHARHAGHPLQTEAGRGPVSNANVAGEPATASVAGRPAEPSGGEAQTAPSGGGDRGPAIARVQDTSTSEGEGSSRQGQSGARGRTMEIAGIFNQTSRGEPAAPALQATAAGPQGSAAGSLRASVAEQIARRAHLAVGQGRAGLSIQLEPKDLGKVQVHVSIGADGLRVGLAAEASDTREIIQASLPLLRAAFESQGLVVERFDLGIGAGFAGWGSPGGSAQQRQGLGSGQPNGYYPANEETGVDGGEVYETGPRDTLVDYRI